MDGCSASVEHGEKSGTALSFDILLLGSGLGGSAEYHTSTIWTFNASSGQTKAIFVSASVRVVRVIVLERGRQIAAGFRVDATTSDVSEPAALLLPPEVTLPAIDIAKTYPLAGDTSGDIAEYKYRYEKEMRRSFRINISALQVGAKVKTSVQVNGSLALTYRFRGGYDYELRYLTEGHGLVWSFPTPPS